MLLAFPSLCSLVGAGVSRYCQVLAEDGKRQFLSGVLHNICRALSADSSIERETFQERLRSAGLLEPVLGEEAAEGGEKRERE